MLGDPAPEGYYRLPPDVPPEFASVHYKLLNGASHLKTLDTDIVKWRDEGGYELRTDRDLKTGEKSVRIIFGEELPPRWGVCIGDIVQNLRNALDNLVYAMAEACARSPLSEKQAKDIAFPIYGRNALTDKRAEQMMPNVPTTVQDFIKSKQPHLKGDPNYRSTVLWIIHRLANVDKHRSVHVAALQSRGIRFTDPPKGMSGIRSWDRFTSGKGGLPLENNEVITRYTLTGTDEDMKIELPLDIVFKEVDPAMNLSVLGSLSAGGKFVITDVAQPIAALYKTATQPPAL